MPVYSQQQLDTLQGYIANAQSSLKTGDYASAIQSLNSYYGAQTNIRGYASDALQVINNIGVFGHVANQDLIDDLGASYTPKLMAQIAVGLASADFSVISNNPNAVPTENQISNYHYNVYTQNKIDITDFGGASAAALGVDWGVNTLKAAEVDADLSNNLFATKMSQSQILEAIGNVEAAGVASIPKLGASDVPKLWESFKLFNRLEAVYDVKFGTQDFTSQNLQHASNQTLNGANGQFVSISYDPDANDALINSVSAIAQSDGSLLYGVSGQNITEQLTNQAVSISDHSSATVLGDGNSISLVDSSSSDVVVEGRSVAVTSNSNSLSVEGEASSVGITGRNNIISVADGDNTTISGNTNAVSASSASITFLSGDVGEKISGDSNNITATNGNTITETGNNEINNATGATITLTSGDTGATVTGDGNTIRVSSGDAVSLTGDNETVNGSASSLTFAAGDTGASVNGSGDNITVATGDSVTISGDRDAMSCSSATLTFGSGDTACSVTGNTNTISVASGDALTESGTGERNTATGATLTFVSGDTGETVKGDSDTVSAASGDSITFTGDNETIAAAGVTLSFASGDTGEVVTGNTNVIRAASGDSVTESGSGDKTTASGATLSFTSGGTGETISGSNDTISAVSGDSLTVTGNGDAITADGSSIGFAAGDTGSVTGSNDNVTLKTYSDSSLTFSGTGTVTSKGSTTSQTDANTITLAGTNTSLTVTGSDNIYSMTGSQDSLTVYETDLASGVSQEINDYTGGGGSIAHTLRYFNFVNSDGTDDGSEKNVYNPSSNILDQYTDYSAANETGSVTQSGYFYANGTAQTTFVDPYGKNNLNSLVVNYDTSNRATTGVGTYANGTHVNITYNYNSGGSFTGQQVAYYGSNGASYGYENYNASDQATGGTYGGQTGDSPPPDNGYFVTGVQYADPDEARHFGGATSKTADEPFHHGPVERSSKSSVEIANSQPSLYSVAQQASVSPASTHPVATAMDDFAKALFEGAFGTAGQAVSDGINAARFRVDSLFGPDAHETTSNPSEIHLRR